VKNIEIYNLNIKDIKELQYEKFVELINSLSPNEIIKLSNKIGYPVFTRLCMGDLKHKFVLLQDGASAIILNKDGQILLQSRSDRDKWGLPGGCQELGESFEDTVIREIKEETNLEVKYEDLEFIAMVSGSNRVDQYPNGDIVINNTALYCVRKYNGELKWNSESKEMKFFDLDNLPKNQHDEVLIEVFLKSIKK